MDQITSYCAKLVRENDPDRYLLSMLLPTEKREALWALFAFHYEVAKTREIVTDMNLGRIRLQWWRDAIDKIYAGEELPSHQVVEALAYVAKAYDLSQADFHELIEARSFDLENTRPTHVEGLLHYCDASSSPLVRLALAVEGVDALQEPVHVVAVNYALIGVLRAVPHMAAQGRSLLPQSETGIAVIAQSFEPDVAASSRLLRGMQALAQMHYKQLKRVGFDLAHPKMQIPPAFKGLRVLLAAR